MQKLFTEEEFIKSKSRDLLPLLCKNCNCIFKVAKNRIQQVPKINNKTNRKKFNFCSTNCNRLFFHTPVLVVCKNCNKEFKKQPKEIKKSVNNFCSRSCSVTYNNTHKTKGTRRSKLELFLESQLALLYPSLNILYNEKSTINSELDIYIPSLNLAFELNGIFHYEPIYGQDKLEKTQNNDNRKIIACYEKNIELCIIDVSSLKYFKPDNAKKYLDIITSIIERKLTLSSTIQPNLLGLVSSRD